MLEMNKPYIYRIKNKITGQFYYGSKYSSVCCYTTFWKDYFTSSSTIKKLIKLYGINNWDIKILKTYQTAREALMNEQKYIKRCFKSKYSLNLRYFNYNNETLDDINPVDKMIMTRKIINNNGETSYILGGRKTAKTKKSLILSDGRTLMQATVDKTTETRKNRGDYEKLSQELTGVGKGIGSEIRVCEYCSKETNSGNYTRWHGLNCIMNPNITEEQILKRVPHNKGKTSSIKGLPNEKLKGFVSAYDLEKKINIRVSKKIFDLNPNLVGMGTKGTPSYKEKEISKETGEKLSKVNKGKKHKESTKQLISIKACERKGLYLWVNNPNTNEKTKIKKEIASNFLKENPEWKLGKGKNKKESNEK